MALLCNRHLSIVFHLVTILRRYIKPPTRSEEDEELFGDGHPWFFCWSNIPESARFAKRGSLVAKV